MGAPIEFVVSDEPVEPLPPSRPPHRHRWLTRVVVLVVVLAAGIGWVASRPTARPPAAAQANRPVPSILNDEPYQMLRCHHGAPIPGQVLAAVDRYLVRATVQQPLTTRCIRTSGSTRRVVAEAVIVNAAGYDLRISLSAPDAKFPPIAEPSRANMLGRIETEAAGVKVRVIASGRHGASAPMARLQKLADYLSLNTALPSAMHKALDATDAERCRVVPDCSVDSAIPAAVAAAIETAMGSSPRPTISARTVVQVNSLTLTDQLVRRDLRVSKGPVTVLIRVQRGGPKKRVLESDPLGTGSLLLSADASGYVVRLQYLAPETMPPALTRLRALARDPRLETL